MTEQETLWSVSDIMKLYGVSRMTIHRRVSAGVLTPVNTVPVVLYRQHKLLFRQSEVRAAFGEPIKQAA